MKSRIFCGLGCLLTACITSNSCRKPDEHRCQPIPECQPIPASNGPFGYEEITAGRSVQSVSYNPNNDNEFVFWVRAEGPRPTPLWIDTLFVYNKATGEQRNILEGDLEWAAHWGKNGWILFNSMNGIAMIKPNGDSLTIISREYSNATWNASCTRIYAVASYDRHMNVLLNLDGTVADSFQFGADDVDFIDDDRLLAGSVVFTISTRHYDTSNVDGWTGSRMISANEYIWFGYFAINKTNIFTRQTVKLKETPCKSQVYLNPSVNGSKTKVLWRRITYRADTCFGHKLFSNYDIVEMNTDGTGEQEISIPGDL